MSNPAFLALVCGAGLLCLPGGDAMADGQAPAAAVTAAPTAADPAASTAAAATAAAGSTAPAAKGATFPDKKSVCEAKCQSSSAFCIDVSNGKPFCEGVAEVKGDFGLPRELTAGKVWTVRVIGDAEVEVPCELTVGEVKSADRLMRDAPRRADRAEAKAYAVLKEVVYTVPSTEEVAGVQVVFTRKAAPELTETYEVSVNHGRYFVDIGLLMPVVPFGRREIAQTAIPGTGGERRLALREDWSVEAALALNVFPCGRRRGLYSAFQRVGVQTLCDLFGLQVGLDLDFKNAFQRIYAGLVLEPIAGISAGFGLALVKGQFFPDGYASGMLIPKGESFTPDTEYMVRPYLGITLSADILTSLSAASGVLKSKL